VNDIRGSLPDDAFAPQPEVRARIDGALCSRCALVGTYLCCLSVVVYGLSLLLPAFQIAVEGTPSNGFGYEAVVLGLLSPCFPFHDGKLRLFGAWLANPILWVGLFNVAIGRHKTAYALGVAATALSATFLFGDLILIGYYTWFLSMGMFTVGAGIKCFVRPENTKYNFRL